MLFQTLQPSSALSITRFSDIDAFRPVEFVANARSVPLNLDNFRTARAMVALPDCQVNVHDSFARIVDASYRVPHGVILFQLEDNYEVSANGMSVNGPAFIAMRGQVDCQFVEPHRTLHAFVTLSPSLRDRGWFDRPDQLCAFTPNAGALEAARSIVTRILQTASTAPDLMNQPDFSHAMQEKLLLTIDEMFQSSRTLDSTDRASNRTYCRIVREVDEYVAFHAASPIYSAQLAATCGVSIRTLGTAVASVRGMSLHRYLRLKQLWSARTQLVRGSDAVTVASCARANGFHHMGEFARLYRTVFQETPSRTLSRARGID